MKSYEFRGTFTLIVQANSQESADELAQEQLGEVLLNWRIDEVSSD